MITRAEGCSGPSSCDGTASTVEVEGEVEVRAEVVVVEGEGGRVSGDAGHACEAKAG